jgi:hypothetical protein
LDRIVAGGKEHRRKDCATAAAEDEPEGAEELGDQFVFQCHGIGGV